MKRSGVLFGSVFFLAGCAILFFTVISPVIDASRMQFWYPAQAQLTSAEVTSHQSRNDDGSYTSMYKVAIRYQYNVDGHEYLGHRAKISNDSSSSDSSDAYWLLSKVKYEQSSKNSITVWYDPDNVADSIYYRGLNLNFLLIMTLFSGVFITVGFGIITYSRTKNEAIPLNVNAETPWTSREQWASPLIYSTAKTSVKYAWYFAFLSALFFGMFSLTLWGQHPIATAFAVLLLIVPLWLVVRARRIQKEWHFFKEVPLELSRYPGVIGGKVEGSVTIPGQVSFLEKCSVTLQCTHYWTKRSGNKTESSQSIIFSKEQQITAKSRVNGAYIEFDFDVPADKPQSSAPSRNYYKWSVVIQAKVSEVNFNREYEVPVFITHESMTVADELKKKPLTATEKSAMNERLDLDISLIRGEMTLHTPGTKTSLFIAGIGGIFFISGVLIATIGNSVFGVFFALMSCIFVSLGIWGYGRNCKIQIKPNRLQLDVYFFSKRVRHLVFQQADVNTIEAFSSSKMHINGKQTNEKFSLRLITQLGKRIDLGGDFDSMKKAVHLKQQIEQLLGVGLTVPSSSED
ncbi:DUF3592 domain-containing protein [Thalassotalea piscium]